MPTGVYERIDGVHRSHKRTGRSRQAEGSAREWTRRYRDGNPLQSPKNVDPRWAEGEIYDEAFGPANPHRELFAEPYDLFDFSPRRVSADELRNATVVA